VVAQPGQGAVPLPVPQPLHVSQVARPDGQALPRQPELGPQPGERLSAPAGAAAGIEAGGVPALPAAGQRRTAGRVVAVSGGEVLGQGRLAGEGLGEEAGGGRVPALVGSLCLTTKGDKWLRPLDSLPRGPDTWQAVTPLAGRPSRRLALRACATLSRGQDNYHITSPPVSSRFCPVT
jgi:hypothetical protein